MTPSAAEHVSSYGILVDGTDLAPEHMDRIKEIRVVNYLRLPDVCTIHITYPRGDGIDRQPFDVGKPIEVRLGARQELAPQTLFKGQVVTLEPEFGAGGCSLAVRAYDRSHLLHRSRVVRTFQNQTSSDIVTKIVSQAGLTPRCDPSGEPHEFVQQDNETDWDFIWRLAERVGFEFVIEDTTAHFRKPVPEGALELSWPETLASFRPRVTAVQQVSKVSLLAHDPKTKEVIQGTASAPVQIAQIGVGRDAVTGAFDEATVHVATEPVKSKAEGDALAQALLDKLANGYISAEGTAPGNPRIRAGATLKVSGVGTKFSGTYRVSASTHVLRGGGAYQTHFANSAAHTILGTVGGDGAGTARFGSQIVLGIVTNNKDPQRMGRVRVRYPALGPDAEGAWARVVTLSAGRGRGLLMLPVVGEEVLVAFEHDDTTRPYVLGSLFNGRDLPGDRLLQGHDGSLALRSEHSIVTVAAGDYVLEAGGKLSVNVGDDVKESFGKDWTNETSGKISLTAGGSVAIEGGGQSVTLTGAAEVKIEGSTTLTLSCGGSQIALDASGVKISGAMITLG